jgi:UDP-N-acetylglucosamine 1-carboxyvinyltransferase
VSERFYVEGGKQLQGEIEVSGAKNAALKFVAAALLTPGKTVLHHVPRIKDMHTSSPSSTSSGSVRAFREAPWRSMPPP